MKVVVLGVPILKLQSFRHFYVMGKALSGDLSCTRIAIVFISPSIEISTQKEITSQTD